MKKHLRYEYNPAWDAGETRHAQMVMKELGVSYQYAVPQSIGEQWWFWNCENIPEKLPAYITELNISPVDAIGYGLSAEMAAEIMAASNKGLHTDSGYAPAKKAKSNRKAGSV